jgi:hypothetical protein
MTRISTRNLYFIVFIFLQCFVSVLGFLPPLNAQDYSISTAGNELVITDLSGNTDVMALEGVATGMSISISGRTYSLNGAAAAAFPVTIANIANYTKIVVNGNAGNDVVNFRTFFSISLPSIQVNGGSGNDVINVQKNLTLAPNANIDFDLQNDAAFNDEDEVNWAMSALVQLSGTGSVIIKVSRSIRFNFISGIVTENGNQLFEANQQPFIIAGNFNGFQMDGALLQSTGSGNITIAARGGTPTSSGRRGVFINSGGVIQTNTGAIAITGQGSNGNFSSQTGITVTDNNTRIESLNGNVTISGLGGEGIGLDGHIGVYINNGAVVRASGNGVLTVSGTSPTQGTYNCYGVLVNGTGSSIEVVNGQLNLTGQAGGSNGFNNGVMVNLGGAIRSTGSGTVAVTGTGPASSQDFGNYGVQVIGANSVISTTTGALQVTGTGLGSNGNGNIGISVSGGGRIGSTSGPIEISGIGGNSADDNGGIEITGTNSTITSNTGTITLTGTEGTGVNSCGISMTLDATISTNGNVTLISNCINNPSGTSINSGPLAILRPRTNTIPIRLGTGSNLNNGEFRLTEGQMNRVSCSGGNGTLAIGSTTSSNIEVTGSILHIVNDLQIISGGDIHLNNGSLTVSGGNLSLQPGSPSGKINPNRSGNEVSANTTTLNGALNIALNGTTPGTGSSGTFSQLGVSGSINLNGANLLLSGNLNPQPAVTLTIVNVAFGSVAGTFNGLPQGATFTLNLAIPVNCTISYNGGDGNDVTLQLAAAPANYFMSLSGGSLFINDGINAGDILNLSASGTNLVVNTNSTRTYKYNNGNVAYFPATLANLNTVNELVVNTFGGDDVIQFNDFTGVSFPFISVNAGSGNDELRFNGAINFRNNFGINGYLSDDDLPAGADRIVLTSNANLQLTGIGNVLFIVDQSIECQPGSNLQTQNGNLTMFAGLDLPLSGDFVGVDIDGATVKTTGTASMQIIGRGGDAASGQQHGIYLHNGGKIYSGSGEVSLTGIGGNSTGLNNHGVFMEDNGSEIIKESGQMNITGNAGTGSQSTGIMLLPQVTMAVQPGEGTLHLKSDNIFVHPNAAVFMAGATSSIQLSPVTDNYPITLGIKLPGTLSLTSGDMAGLLAHSIIVGSNTAGTIDVMSPVSCFPEVLRLQSGADVKITGGFITCLGDVILDPGAAPFAVEVPFGGNDIQTTELSFGSDLKFTLNGTTPGTGSVGTYTTLSVQGQINLTGVDLVLDGAFSPIIGQSFIVVVNDGADPIVGTFNGLPEGATFSTTLNGILYDFTVSYIGSTGNDVVLTVSGALPVTWLSFEANWIGKQAQLDWATSAEVNNEGFYIERSVDGRNFRDIGFVTAQSGAATGAIYQYTDMQTPLTERLYYRLRQQDRDGRTQYSDIHTLNAVMDSGAILYPNPVADRANLQVTLPEAGSLRVEILDAQGKLILTSTIIEMDAGTHTIPFTPGALPAGSYRLRIVSDAEVQQISWMKI